MYNPNTNEMILFKLSTLAGFTPKDVIIVAITIETYKTMQGVEYLSNWFTLMLCSLKFLLSDMVKAK